MKTRAAVATVAAGLAAVAGCSSPGRSSHAADQRGGVAPLIATSRRVAPVPAGQQIAVRVAVDHTNALDAVAVYLSKRGLRGVSVDRGLGEVSGWGTARALQADFRTHLYRWHASDGEDFMANDVPPSLPAGLGAGSVTVFGLDDSARGAPAGVAKSLIGQDVALSAKDVQDVYNLTSLLGQSEDGRGQTVAIYAESGVAQDAINHFISDNNLPPISVVTTAFAMNPGSSAATLAAAYGPTQDLLERELEMDIEAVHTTSPRATVHLYEFQGGSYTSRLDAFLSALTTYHLPGENVASISFSGCESMIQASYLAALQTHFALVAKQGHFSILASSGDHGKNCLNGKSVTTGVEYPAGDPSVTAVGGTHLQMTGLGGAGGSRSTEVAWDDSGKAASGGGTSTAARPAWQIAAGLAPGPRRMVPDVAATAAADGGLEIYAWDPAPNPYCPFLWAGCYTSAPGTGTSLSAPLWAGLVAVVDQIGQAHQDGPAGELGPLIYQMAFSNPGALFDITGADNSGSDLAGPVGPGWDSATGLGSPNAAVAIPWLAAQLIPLAPSVPYTNLHTVDWSSVTVPPDACGTAGPVKLARGRAAAGSTRFPRFDTVTVYAPAGPVFGDLDGTGHDAAALLVVCDTGGFTAGSTLADNLVVYGGGGGVHPLGLVSTLSPPVSGEPAAQMNPPSVKIGLHRLTATEAFYHPSDPQCCPSGSRNDIWSWNGNSFTPEGGSPAGRA